MKSQSSFIGNPELSIQDDLLRLMLDSIKESLILLDTNLRIVECNEPAKQGVWNKAGIKISSYSYFPDLFSKEKKDQVRKICLDILKGKSQKAEALLEYDNDTFIINSFLPARNHAGDITGILIQSKETTLTNNQADTLIKEAEERWQFALEAANQAAWDWDMKTNKVIYSGSYRKLYGFAEGELNNILSEWESRIHPEDKLRMKSALIEHIKSDNPYYESTYRLQMKDGTYKWILARGKLLSKDNDGKPLRMIGTHTDLTDTMKTQQALQKMNDRFLYAAKASSQALWEWDALTGEAYVSPSFTELFGWKADADQRFEQWHQYVHPDDREKTVDGYYTTLNKTADSVWQSEYRFLKADGTYAMVSDKAYILRDAKNAVVKVIGATEDISEKKKIEEDLSKSTERFDKMLKATNELLWEWDILTNSITRAEEGLRKVYGISDDSSIRTFPQLLERVHPDDRQKINQIINDLLHSSLQQTFEIEYRFIKDDGSYTYVYDRGILLKNEKGEPERMIGAAQNISRRKELEQELLKTELEYKKLINQATVDSQEQERSEIGRELHDNINQVLTTTKLYLELALANKEMTYELIKKSSNNVSNLITEIRQLSRSLMDPTIGDLGIIDSINDLVDNINLTKKLFVSFEVDESIESLLNRNQKLTIFRIVQESINNVIKHAKANFVMIFITYAKDEIQLLVKDDGIGFLHDSVKKGAGLKNITNRVYLINGSFVIESEPGKGSSIKINFPIQKTC